MSEKPNSNEQETAQMCPEAAMALAVKKIMGAMDAVAAKFETDRAESNSLNAQNNCRHDPVCDLRSRSTVTCLPF